MPSRVSLTPEREDSDSIPMVPDASKVALVDATNY